MARRGLLVRHLVMPGLLDETEAILRFVATELGPGTYVNVMAQYYPRGSHERVPGDRPLPLPLRVRAGARARRRTRLGRLDERSRAAVTRLPAA
jgi:putative pyruvate formate lyase activating enzyme